MHWQGIRFLSVEITGSSGFLGFHILVSTLSAGYRVLATVSRKEEADHILSTRSIRKLGDNLTFVTIPDIAADGSLAEAVKRDIQYIIHTDSPMTVSSTVARDRYESQIIQPLLKSTNNVLSAALDTPSVKRVVITSSLMGIAPYNDLFEFASFVAYTDDSPIPDPRAPYPNALAALCAGKAKSLAATKAFLIKNKPQFTIVNLMPSIVIGPDELAKTSKDLNKGSNQQVLRHLRGENVSTKLPSHTVYVWDVARAHVLSLDTEKVAKSQNFLLNSAEAAYGVDWYRALEIVKKEYQDGVKNGWLALDGEQPIVQTLIDYSLNRAEKVFGFKFAGFDEQIRNLLHQWVQLKNKEAKDK
ncbi:MAG: hypothetical protein Q9178_003637 [Gyalolechia marmorata]